jgi:hypothetical protein
LFRDIHNCIQQWSQAIRTGDKQHAQNPQETTAAATSDNQIKSNLFTGRHQ